MPNRGDEQLLLGLQTPLHVVCNTLCKAGRQAGAVLHELLAHRVDGGLEGAVLGVAVLCVFVVRGCAFSRKSTTCNGTPWHTWRAACHQRRRTKRRLVAVLPLGSMLCIGSCMCDAQNTIRASTHLQLGKLGCTSDTFLRCPLLQWHPVALP